MKKFILIFSISILTSCAYAQFGEIRGKVTDRQTGQVMAGATIVYDINGSQKGTISDENGEYKIKPLVP